MGIIFLTTSRLSYHQVHYLSFSQVLGKPSVGAAPTVHNLLKPTYVVKKVKNPVAKSLKKKLKDITQVLQPIYCDVCKLYCNSQEVYNSHKMGKKHKKNVEKLNQLMAPKPSNADTSAANKGNEANDEAKRKAKEEDLEAKKRKILVGGAATDLVKVCTLCNVVCNSQGVFDFHIAGKKHAAMLKKQQQRTTS